MYRPALSLRRAAATLAATAAVLVATPTLASAATVTVPGQCYVYYPGTPGDPAVAQPIPFTASGLAPSQQVRVALEVKGKIVEDVGPVPADSTGAITTELTGWTPQMGKKPTRSTPARLIINDAASGAELGAAPFKVTNLAFRVDGARKRASVKRVWEVSGLSPLSAEDTYYAHYFKGSKYAGKQRLGRSTDACGYIRVKKLLVPFKATGVFKVRVQSSRTYNKDLPWIGTTIEFFRIFR